MSESTQQNQEPWHLDRRVPVVLILGMVVQAAGFVWWASSVNSQVQDHGRRIVVMEAADTRMTQEAQRLSEQIARMDERLISQTAILRRIEESLGARYQPQR